MKYEDDPEARIRDLERPLSDQARASELGGGQHNTGGAYLPPPVPGYTAPDYSTQASGSPPPSGTQPYGAQPYGAQPYGAQPYGAQPYGTPYPTPRRKVSGGIPWLVFGLIAIVLVAIAAGVIVFTTKMSGVTRKGDGGSINIPSFPSFPSIPSVPSSIPAPPGAPGADPEVIVGSPGEQVTVSGVDENKTVACNDASVSISGIRNTVNITGHCMKVSVSGINNVITVDIADTIGASGFDNRVTFHAGSPQIENSGGNNVVEQG
jgi:hypothetical protein